MMLAVVAEKHPAAHAALLQSLKSAARIADALPVEWLPIEIDIEVMEALSQALTPAQIEELVVERQRREMGSALFKTFVVTTGKLLGFTPATMVRQLPKGWRQVMQDCGEIEISAIEARAATAWIRGLPPACLASAAWIGALRPGLGMLFELVSSRGEVDVSIHGGDVRVHFTW
jgi:hypothetical protein